MIAVEILQTVKIFGIVHVTSQYSSNMIFWISITWYNSFGPGNYRNALEGLHCVIW